MKIKILACAGIHIPPLTGRADARDVQTRYWRVFNPLKEVDFAMLTTTERYLLRDAVEAVSFATLTTPKRGLRRDACDSRFLEQSVLDKLVQSTGRFDRSTAMLRLAQAKRFIDNLGSLASAWPPSDTLEQLTLPQKQALTEQMVRAGQKALNISSNIAIEICPEPDPTAPLMYADASGYKLSFFPIAFELNFIHFAGLVLHECLHTRQYEDALLAQGDDDMRALREPTFLTAVAGPLLPLDMTARGKLAHLSLIHNKHYSPNYPLHLQNEREGWMLQIAAKIVASHHPDFAPHAGRANPDLAVYAAIGLDELERHGPEDILSQYAKRAHGVDMAQMAALCGVRQPVDQSPDASDAAWQAMGKLQDTLLQHDPTITRRNTRMLLADFRFDMLNTIADVLAAAEDATHPYQKDAELLIIAVKAYMGFKNNASLHPLFAIAETASPEEFDAGCRAESEQLKTEFGRTVLHQLALFSQQIFPGVPAYPERRRQITKAIWFKE